ncbi:hypothetical protein AVEN_231525-1 [Araneus ventricosus]|uniref:Uncharacterized protein n=1 Tax=Araneus ventricosus TaxID=182803 RepID=A0A4Y2IBD3_ARAVE|nr:hypothetical protein AVEN_231525-1 [Araneus ventricosus]
MTEEVLQNGRSLEECGAAKIQIAIRFVITLSATSQEITEEVLQNGRSLEECGAAKIQIAIRFVIPLSGTSQTRAFNCFSQHIQQIVRGNSADGRRISRAISAHQPNEYATYYKLRATFLLSGAATGT